jgi:hypothetical protein
MSEALEEHEVEEVEDEMLENEEATEEKVIEEDNETAKEAESEESEKDQEDESEDDNELEKLRSEAEKLREINKKLERDNKANFEKLKKYKKDQEPEVEMTEEEQDLKYEDPDAYAKLYAKRYSEALEEQQKALTKEQQEQTLQDQIVSAIEEKEKSIDNFREVLMYPDGSLKVDHIPPVKLKEWEELPIGEQLEKAYELLSGAKVKNPKTLKQPNLSKVGGGAKPTSSRKTATKTYDELE